MRLASECLRPRLVFNVIGLGISEAFLVLILPVLLGVTALRCCCGRLSSRRCKYQTSRTHTIITLEGKIYQGRILDQNDEQLTVAIDPKSPSAVIQIKADNIDEILPSKTSMMPLGLLNTLTREEILDLLAYIQSGGDPEHALFE